MHTHLLISTQILGGADTLAISTKAVFYHVLKSPSAKAKLVQELRSAALASPAPYQALEKLPYLDACIKEGLRIHPVLGHVVERVVPADGLTLPDGTVLPPGTIVGVNPWVMHENEAIFGKNADQYIPERWLQGASEAPEAYRARIKKMKDADMSFGGGNRACLGRPLALMELYKVVSFVFGNYEVCSRASFLACIWANACRLILRTRARSGICISNGLSGRMMSRLR
jgi:cytochrome P450